MTRFERLIANERWSALKRRLPKNNQHGFTLIELLVVISILGILAAVVTMSMVGITTVANQRAAVTEKATVQSAMDAMLADQGVPADQACAQAPGGMTNDMSKFPSAAAWIDPSSSGATHVTKQLFPRYLRQPLTHGEYTCSDLFGTISQPAYNP